MAARNRWTLFQTIWISACFATFTAAPSPDSERTLTLTIFEQMPMHWRLRIDPSSSMHRSSSATSC